MRTHPIRLSAASPDLVLANRRGITRVRRLGRILLAVLAVSQPYIRGEERLPGWERYHYYILSFLSQGWVSNKDYTRWACQLILFLGRGQYWFVEMFFHLDAFYPSTLSWDNSYLAIAPYYIHSKLFHSLIRYLTCDLSPKTSRKSVWIVVGQRRFRIRKPPSWPLIGQRQERE